MSAENNIKMNMNENVTQMPQQALKDYLFTSESVSRGHPDKICDQVSDAILDHMMAADSNCRSAVETSTTTNFIGLLGEMRCSGDVSPETLERIARETVKNIGYEQEGFHWNEMDVDVRVHEQSVDIAQGVDSNENKDEGAGDQGIMFGYACRETDVLMPAPIQYSHDILRALDEARNSGELSQLQPDAKSQVTLEYRDGQPVRATSVVVSTQHNEGLSQSDVKDMVRPVVEKILPNGWMCPEDEFYVNPTGRFVIGGPVGDAGLTGRKIIVDTYGGACPHGGGAFSGKDSSKVDRSAAYAARYAAKNVVAAGYADRCTVQLSYAIGISKPLSFYVNTHGTGTVPEAVLAEALQRVMDFSPRGIRQRLDLLKPIYARTSAYGHFGREPEADGGFSWEKTDLIEALHKDIG